jgi:type I restriction enzyme R subunit
MPEELKAREHQRFALYKAVAALLRAYANIADDLPQAGYSAPHVTKIKADVTRAVDLRELIRLASGETIDLKAYEADMRHLIDTYIEARDPKKISAFDDMGLLEVIERSGLAEAIAQMPGAMRKSKDAVAETIANNVRSKIIKEHLNDPAFYDKMSALLKEILDDLKAKRISYEKFLKRIAEEVIKPVQKGTGADTPTELDTPAKRALYSNLKPANPLSGSMNDGNDDMILRLALTIDLTVKHVRNAGWRGNIAKENVIKAALLPLLGNSEDEVERIFPVIIAQAEY